MTEQLKACVTVDTRKENTATLIVSSHTRHNELLSVCVSCCARSPAEIME